MLGLERTVSKLGENMMHAIKKLMTISGYLVVLLSFLSGFMVGAIFGETVINKSQQPTALTYYLAGVTR
jgi:hypothetical protein